MRTSILGAAFLLAGASAATLAAAGLDTNGNGLALNGSDTLFDITTDIVNGCATQFSSHNPANTMSPYQGGGSGVGAGNMNIGNQAISPMSTAMGSSNFCVQGGTSTVYSGTNAADPTKAEALLLGIDGVAITANQTNSCSTSAANGFGGTSMTLSTGTYTFGDPAAAKFANQPAFDALSLLYFGFDHNGNYNCAGEARKTMISSWANLFQSTCSGGNGTCSAGLTHAWRRSDLSGTTDAFTKILNPPNGNGTNGKATTAHGVGIGSLSNLIAAGLPGTSTKSNPFCNSKDASTATNTTTIESNGGDSDFSDLDPIRTPCGTNGTLENVCEPALAVNPVNNQGDLGLVVPVLIPDSTVTLPTDVYPAATCGPQCVYVAVGPVKPAYRCPGTGVPPTAGACLFPGKQGDPRCISNQGSKCLGAPGNPDGRFYNLTTITVQSQFSGNSNSAVRALVGNKPFQIAIDANLRELHGSYFRIHQNTAGLHNVPDPTGAGTTGLCKENDDTSQIGCLTDSDPCSIGFAGRESAKGYPGISTGPTSQPLKALAVNGVPPFDLVPADNNQDLYLQNLLTGSGTIYPMARRLYLATIYGFGTSLQGAEQDLAACFGTEPALSTAVGNHGFVPVPNGVRCVDYPEGRGTTTTPPPNSAGTGNAAFGGCNGTAGTTVGSNTDACTALGTRPVDTSGNPVPEMAETF